MRGKTLITDLEGRTSLQSATNITENNTCCFLCVAINRDALAHFKYECTAQRCDGQLLKTTERY